MRRKLPGRRLILGAMLFATTAGAQCNCDCDGDGRVSITDLIRMANVALGIASIDRCPRENSDIHIYVLVSCVDWAIHDRRCPPPSATPSTTATVTATATDTPTPTPSRPPTETPTVFPPADTAAAETALQLIETIALNVCGTGATPGGRFDISAAPAGASLYCGSFTGHTGRFSLSKYPSSAAAEAAFGIPGPEESVEPLGGGTLRELRWMPPCCPHLGGVSTQWKWQRDCWLAGGNTFDDTHYIFTPQGLIVAAAIVESGMLDELLALCPEP